MQRLERGPVFPVQFSFLRDGVPKIVEDESIFEPRQSVLRIGFGFAPILQPGTIWRNKVFRSRWPFNQIIAETVVDPNVPILNAYGKSRIDGLDRYILPKGQVAIDSRAAGSLIALFTASVAGEPIQLLIPCMEIFRFYYGHSTRLAYRILRGDFLTAPYWLYDENATRVDRDGNGRLELAPSMDVADAYTIGRFVLDPVGLRRAKAIVSRAAIVDGGSSPLDVLPPFNGPWRERVRGRWLSYGRTRGFLVYAIVRCEAAVPFKELLVYGGFAREASASRTEKTASEGNEVIDRRRTVAPLSNVVVRSGDPAHFGLPQRLPTIDRDDRYPNVRVEHVLRRRKRKSTGTASGKAFRQVPTPGSQDSSVAVSDTPVDQGPNPGFFVPRRRGGQDLREGRDMLALYQQALDMMIEIAIASGFTCEIDRRVMDLVDAFTAFAPTKAYLDRAEKRSRSVLLATVRLTACPALVIEIQRRPGAREESRTLIVADASFKDIDEDHLTKILARWTFRDGHLRDLDGVKSLENVRLSGANHRHDDTAASYARRILGKIVDLIDDIDGGALGSTGG